MSRRIAPWRLAERVARRGPLASVARAVCAALVVLAALAQADYVSVLSATQLAGNAVDGFPVGTPLILNVVPANSRLPQAGERIAFRPVGSGCSAGDLVPHAAITFDGTAWNQAAGTRANRLLLPVGEFRVCYALSGAPTLVAPSPAFDLRVKVASAMPNVVGVREFWTFPGPYSPAGDAPSDLRVLGERCTPYSEYWQLAVSTSTGDNRFKANRNGVFTNQPGQSYGVSANSAPTSDPVTFPAVPTTLFFRDNPAFYNNATAAVRSSAIGSAAPVPVCRGRVVLTALAGTLLDVPFDHGVAVTLDVTAVPAGTYQGDPVSAPQAGDEISFIEWSARCDASAASSLLRLQRTETGWRQFVTETSSFAGAANRLVVPAPLVGPFRLCYKAATDTAFWPQVDPLNPTAADAARLRYVRDASLRSLGLQGLGAIAGFSPSVTAYTINVADTFATATFDAVTNSPYATVTVEGGGPDLLFGSNTRSLRVRAEDSTTTRVYSVTIQRAACTPPPSDPLTTDYPNRLDADLSNFDNDTLTLVFYESMKYFDTEFVYPRDCSASWTWSFQHIGGAACERRWTGRIRWADAYTPNDPVGGCGVTMRTDGDFAVFDFALSVRNRENLPPVAGRQVTRSVTHAMPFEIRFLTSLTVSSSVNVSAPINVVAGITLQEVTGAPPGPVRGNVRLLATVQWPFKLVNPAVTLLPPGISLQSAGFETSPQAPQDCVDENGRLCASYFRFVFAPAPGTCTFSGRYTVQLEVACHDSYLGNCPVDPDNDTVAINATLQSSTHCAQLVDTVTAVSSLVSFGDGDFLEQRDDFLDGQRIFFQAPTTSAKASLAATTFSAISITRADNSVLQLVSDSTVGNAGTALELLVNSGGPAPPTQASVAAFSFLARSNILGARPDATTSVTISATIRVRYVVLGAVREAAPLALGGDAAAQAEETRHLRLRLALPGLTRGRVRALSENRELPTLTTRRIVVGPSTARGDQQQSEQSGLSPFEVAIIGGCSGLAVLAVVGAVCYVRRSQRKLKRALAESMAAQGQTGSTGGLTHSPSTIELLAAPTAAVTPRLGGSARRERGEREGEGEGLGERVTRSNSFKAPQTFNFDPADFEETGGDAAMTGYTGVTADVEGAVSTAPRRAAPAAAAAADAPITPRRKSRPGLVTLSAPLPTQIKSRGPVSTAVVLDKKEKGLSMADVRRRYEEMTQGRPSSGSLSARGEAPQQAAAAPLSRSGSKGNLLARGEAVQPAPLQRTESSGSLSARSEAPALLLRSASSGSLSARGEAPVPLLRMASGPLSARGDASAPQASSTTPRQAQQPPRAVRREEEDYDATDDEEENAEQERVAKARQAKTAARCAAAEANSSAKPAAPRTAAAVAVAAAAAAASGRAEARKTAKSKQPARGGASKQTRS